MQQQDIIGQIAEKLAFHQAIPFLGAGCSLGFAPDWDSLRNKMCVSLGKPITGDHLQIAQEYENVNGRSALLEFLRSHLDTGDVDETSAPVYSAMIAMDLGWYYTTNLETVFEKICGKAGRPLDVIVEDDDFASRDPRIPALYKFHGSIDKPNSVVISQSDYQNRISQTRTNAMDIRLRSDALGKSIVFFGYSFRDPNVQGLLKELVDVFSGSLPTAFLVEFEHNEDFSNRMLNDFGIVCVCPQSIYSDIQSKEVAFETFIAELSKEVCAKKTKSEIAELFSGSGSHPETVLTLRELEILELAATKNELSFENQINQFRVKCDLAHIPKELSSRVAAVYTMIASKVQNAHESRLVDAARFHLHLQGGDMLMVLAASIATANVYPDDQEQVFHLSHRVVTFTKEPSVFTYAIAMAILLIKEWGREIQPGFHHFVSNWTSEIVDLDDLPENQRGGLRSAFDWA